MNESTQSVSPSILSWVRRGVSGESPLRACNNAGQGSSTHFTEISGNLGGDARRQPEHRSSSHSLVRGHLFTEPSPCTRARWSAVRSSILGMTMVACSAAENTQSKHAVADTITIPVAAIRFNPASFRPYAPSADLWPVAWAGDGLLYGAGGDGNGFQGPDTRGMTIASVKGSPTHLEGRDRFKKVGVLPTGIISLPGGNLYIIEQLRGGSFDKMRIGRSIDAGRSWTYNGDGLTTWDYAERDGAFAHASFVNHGQDDAGAPADFAYIIAGNPANPDAGFMADQVDLLRVPRNAVQDRTQHEYFAGLDPTGHPLWSRALAQKAPILRRPGQVHWAVRMTWNPVLKRYLLCFFVDKRATLAVYEGPYPWGPWTKIHEATLLDTTEKFSLTFVNKENWLSRDGLTWWGVLTGLGSYDSFGVVKAVLSTKP